VAIKTCNSKKKIYDRKQNDHSKRNDDRKQSDDMEKDDVKRQNNDKGRVITMVPTF
jgi:hypothetical protein